MDNKENEREGKEHWERLEATTHDATADERRVERQAERAVERQAERRRTERMMLPLFVFLGVIVAMTSGVALYDAQRISNNQNTIKADAAASLIQLHKTDAEEQRQLDTIRKLDYRFCVRINDTRGVTLIRLRVIPGGSSKLASDLPMYQCNQTIEDGTTLMTPKQISAYLRLLERGKKPGP